MTLSLWKQNNNDYLSEGIEKRIDIELIYKYKIQKCFLVFNLMQTLFKIAEKTECRN